MKYYYTYVNGNFLPRFLALQASIRRFQSDYLLWVLALDVEVENVVASVGLQSVRLLTLRDLTNWEPRLIEIQQERSKLEFFMTCSPAGLNYILRQIPENKCLTKIDSDCFFLENPDPIHELENMANISITPHRFPDALKDLVRFGKFNAGWVTIKNNITGRQCAEDWKNQCLDWCYESQIEKGYLDQKYIDDWPIRYRGVQVIENPGLNAALWNCGGMTIGLKKDGATLNGQPIILFHFSGLSAIAARIYEVNWNQYQVKPNRILWRKVYLPYLLEVEKARRLLRRNIAWHNVRDTPTELARKPELWKIFTRCLRGKYVHV